MNAETAAAFRSIFRVGEVVSTDPDTCTARVKFPDADDMVSAPLMVAQRWTLKNKSYEMPDIGELVACIFLGNGPIAGFIAFSIYNVKDVPPIVDQDKHYTKYEDDTIFEYDRKEHKLTVNIKGNAEIDIQGENGGTLSVSVKDGIVVGTESDFDITSETLNVQSSACNLNCSSVNLGQGASEGVIHAKSPCPVYGVFHLNPSNTTKTAL